MGLGLRALEPARGLGAARPASACASACERAALPGHQDGFRAATAAGRTFKARAAAGRTGAPAARQVEAASSTSPPTTSSRCSRRRAAPSPRRRSARPRTAADAACATPPELLAQATELGVDDARRPRGARRGDGSERSAVTSVLIGEALAHGDMGIAYAALAPGAVATAIGLWGDGRAAGDLPARLHRRGRRPRRRWRCSSRGRCSTR